MDKLMSKIDSKLYNLKTALELGMVTRDEYQEQLKTIVTDEMALIQEQVNAIAKKYGHQEIL